MSTITGPLKIQSGARVQISSGKIKVEPPGITATFGVTHQNNSNVQIIVRYSIGLTNSVSYSSGYLLRSTHTLEANASLAAADIGTVFIPGAIANDGTIDCYLRMESPTSFFGDTPFVDSIDVFTGNIETSNPNTSNNRFEIKLSASPAAVTATVIEWDL